LADGAETISAILARYTRQVIATCPCGSERPEATCCAPILAGVPAPTALALMRSRYVAYVRGAIDHVVATHAAESRARVDVAAATAWSRDTTWLGLEIVATERGGATDDDGIVEFVARGITRGKPFAQRERSRFRRAAGRWMYVDAAPPGRNEPCPCGSGAKYKKCHGAG
jgi:SEC-C motif-containing protein